jgi:Tfp pilus assembly protein PilF
MGGAGKDSTGRDSAFYNSMAVAFMNEGKFQLASVELHKALRQDPRNAEALNNLGLVHMQFEEYETAIGYFRQATGRDGKLTDAYNNIGVCHMKRKQYKEAETAFRKTLADPFYKAPEVAYYNLGSSLYRQGNYDAAIEAYTSGLRRNPEHLAPLFGIALAHNRADRLSEAAESLQKAIELEPTLHGDQDAFSNTLRKRLETATGDEAQDITDLLDILKY